MVINNVYQFVGSKLRLRYFWKREKIRKRVLWDRRLKLLCTLCTGVLRKFNLHFTLMFYTKSLYKNWLLVSKITWGIWTTSNKQWKVQKVESWWARYYFCPKTTLYTEDLSNITFNCLCENSFFTTRLFYIFLVQKLHTFYKRSPSKWKISDFPLLGSKFTKILMSFFKQKFSFSSKVVSFFSVMGDSSSIRF